MKNNLLKIINPLLAVLLLNQVAAAMLHGVISKDAFEFLHEGGGVVLTIVAVIHVFLNWNWVKANLLPKKPKSS